MASSLIPCPSCSRHVKVGPVACPFCGGAVPTEVTPRPGFSGTPLSRAALLVAGAAIVSACANSCADTHGEPMAAYGGPPPGVLEDAGPATTPTTTPSVTPPKPVPSSVPSH